MRRPRVTVGRLMIGVAALAIVAAVGRFWLLSRSYSERAMGHAYMAFFARGRNDLPQAEYHSAMYEKYQYAATRPWLPLDVDPPRPPFVSVSGPGSR